MLLIFKLKPNLVKHFLEIDLIAKISNLAAVAFIKFKNSKKPLRYFGKKSEFDNFLLN